MLPLSSGCNSEDYCCLLQFCLWLQFWEANDDLIRRKQVALFYPKCSGGYSGFYQRRLVHIQEYALPTSHYHIPILSKKSVSSGRLHVYSRTRRSKVKSLMMESFFTQ